MVLVVIPCLNEEDHLERLVEGLLAANTAQALRIAIIDGGSTDRTPEIARRLAARHANVLFMVNPKRLQSAAINLAVSAYGENETFLIRLDAHADYPGDYCRILVEEAERTKAASVVVAMRTAGHGWFHRAIAAAQNSRLGNGGSAHRNVTGEGKWVDHGHHALMRIEAFRAVGGYDETFSHNEDAELDIRLCKAGFKIWLTGMTELIYYPRATVMGLFRQYYGFGQGRARTFLKHRMRLKIRQLVPILVVPAAIFALLSPFCWIAVIPLSTWAVFCLGYGGMLAFKAKDLSLAASGVAAMVMHFSWSLGFWKQVLLSRKL